jgi:hypothetical protein
MKQEHELKVAGAALTAAIELTKAETERRKRAGGLTNEAQEAFHRGAFAGCYYALLLEDRGAENGDNAIDAITEASRV